ncbi:MAG TPA: sigma-70 family RNA polymerase sigma factor [Flavitalea sp.]|nr:sigma-70 family RNA polymerase sigma factor [Flavitalea sp.]
MIASHQTDHELWKAISENDHVAYTILFERYWAKVYTTAFSYLKNKDDSQEITTEIFLNLWLHRDHLDITSFNAYLRTAARYHVFRHLKKTKAAPVIYLNNFETIHQPSCVNEADENISSQELNNDVNRYLLDLPSRCQYIFQLSRRQHLTNDQIAALLGISRRTVENQLSHALQHLRTSLKHVALSFLIACSSLIHA